MPGVMWLSLKRFFRSSANLGEAATGDSGKAVKVPPPVTPQSSINPGSFQKYVPTYLDKHFLIWSGHYKTRSEIPNALDQNVISKARSWARIRINLGFMVIAIAGAAIMAYEGKQAMKKGESVEYLNKEWHRKINEEHKMSLEGKK